MNLINIIGSLLITSSLLFNNSVIAPTTDIPTKAPIIVQDESLSKDAIISIIKQKSLNYGTEPIIAIAIVEAESRYNQNAIGDKGTSYGLVQIHLPSHPYVTKEQALDPYFAIEFLVSNLSKGKCKMWTTCPI